MRAGLAAGVVGFGADGAAASAAVAESAGSRSTGSWRGRRGERCAAALVLGDGARREPPAWRGRTGRSQAPARSRCSPSRSGASDGTKRASGCCTSCSVLLYVVLFNHQAERASYLIAFTGSDDLVRVRGANARRAALYALAVFDDPRACRRSCLATGCVRRKSTTYSPRAAVPGDLARHPARAAAAGGGVLRPPPVESDELSVEVDLDVALQRG